jgi:hypothetical protein
MKILGLPLRFLIYIPFIPFSVVFRHTFYGCFPGTSDNPESVEYCYYCSRRVQ